MEDLSLDNIKNFDELDSFLEETEETESNSDEKDKKKEKEESEITEVEDLEFDQPESVGEEDEDDKEKEGANSSKGGSSSPDKITFSSIAKAFAEEGIFPDLKEDEYSKIVTAEDFRSLMEKQVEARLDEAQKMVYDAVNAGVETSTIRSYKNTVDYLKSIKEEAIEDEGSEGEQLRKKLIYQDYLNKLGNKDKAAKLTQRSFDAGTDVEDAKEALTSNMEYFQGEFDKIVKEAKEEEKQQKLDREKKQTALKKSIMEDEKLFGDLQIDNLTRAKIVDNALKPVYKGEDGGYYTTIQKYEMDNPEDFLKNVSLVYTLTDGFKDMGKLLKGKVTKEVKKGLKEIEHVLNNTARTSDGKLDFLSGITDKNSSISKFSLDI